MIYRPLFSIAITLALLPSVFGQPPNVWEFETGQWTFESSTGLKSDVTWTPTANGKAIVGEWVGEDGTKSSELIGWRGDRLAVDGFGSENNFWHIVFDQVTPSKCVGPGTVAYPDGTVLTGTLTTEKINADRMEGSLDGKDANGKAARVTWTWTRKAKAERTGDAAIAAETSRQDFDRFVEAWEGRWAGEVIPSDEAESSDGSTERVNAYFDGHAIQGGNALVGTYYAGDVSATWILSYDPDSKSIRSTWIGSDGSNTYGTMEPAGERWILREAGQDSDGRHTSLIGTVDVSGGGEWTMEATTDGKPEETVVNVWHRVSRR